jgi:hypothetical protein
MGNLFFIVDVEARVMKPAATAASQSRGLIGPGTGTDIGPGTDRHQLVRFGRSMSSQRRSQVCEIRRPWRYVTSLISQSR